MITTTNYKREKISIRGIQNKKSRTGNSYKNIPIFYDGKKAIVHLSGRFMVIPDYAPAGDNFGNKGTYSCTIEVDADNRKLFEDFEGQLIYFLENYPGEPWPDSVTDNIRLIRKK